MCSTRTASCLFLVGIALLTIFPACQPNVTPMAPPPPTVSVTPIVQRELQDFVIFTGRTEAAETVDIRARVSGYLLETKFKDGQLVQAGQVLFQIDPRPYQADYEAAKGAYERATADLKLAAIEFTRADELRKKNTISASDFDAKSAAYLRAQGAVSSAKANLDKAALDLEFTTIKTPIAGRIGKATVTPGNLITPQMSEPLATVVSTTPIYAYADIDERQLLRYIRLNQEQRAAGGGDESDDDKRPSTPIELQLADEKGFPHRGVIDFADNRVNPNTGTILIRGIFENADDILGPGLFVRLRFPGGPTYQSLLVPQESIITDQGQKYVFVVGAENKVEYRRVKTGALQEDGWMAVSGDLKMGESVVVEGMIKVRPGEVVRPQPWNSGEAQASPTPAATPESSAS